MRHFSLLRVVGCLAWALLSVIVLTGMWGCDAHAADKQALQALINTHAKANEAKDGATIARILSQNTFDHYERNLKLALDGTKSEILAASVVDRVEVAMIRAALPRKLAEKMTGKEYAIHSTKQGWYSFDRDPEEVSGVLLTNYKFAGRDTAYAQPVGARTRKALPYRYTFIKEGEDWKFDETSSYEYWSAWLEQEARLAGRDVNVYIIEYISERLGKNVSSSLFDRPMR